jgi:hypothetical protein
MHDGEPMSRGQSIPGPPPPPIWHVQGSDKDNPDVSAAIGTVNSLNCEPNLVRSRYVHHLIGVGFAWLRKVDMFFLHTGVFRANSTHHYAWEASHPQSANITASI